MKEKTDVIDSKNLSGYVNNFKDTIKRKYSHYKMNKVRESYRDGLRAEEMADFKKAIQKYNACLEMEPGNLKCLRRLANLYSNLEEHPKACTNVSFRRCHSSVLSSHNGAAPLVIRIIALRCSKMKKR